MSAVEAVFANGFADLLPMGAYVVDADGVITDYNAKAADLWGRSPVRGERVLGEPGGSAGRLHCRCDVNDPPSATRHCPVAAVLADGLPRTGLQAVVTRPDGTRRRVEVHVNPLTDDAGRVTGALVFFHDVTAHKEAEEALRDGEERYRSFIANSSEGIWRYETETPIPTNLPEEEQIDLMFERAYLAECNDAMARMYGYASAGEVLYRRLSEFMDASHPRNREYSRLFVRNGYRIEDAESLETDRDGNPKVFVNSLVGYVEDGHLVRAWGTQRDVTIQRRTEVALQEAYESLRDSEQRLRLLTDSLPAMVGYVDADHRFRSVNRACTEGFGLPAEEVLGRRMPEVLGEEVYRQRLPFVQQALRGEPVHFEGPFHDAAKGSRWVEGSYIPDFAGGKVRGFFVLVHDVTEHRRSEEVVQRAKEAAEAANKSKDQFLAVLSHELRTPLTPVAMTVAALEMDPSLPRQAREDLTMVRRNIDLEAKLIDDLLDVTRISHGKLQLDVRPLAVHELIDSALQICAADIQAKQLHLHKDLAAGDCSAIADAARLQQVFWNLVKNAVKFSSPGGSITVRTANPSPGRLRVELSDDGIGIPQEALDRIFNAFEQGGRTVTRAFGGMGLGLTISRAIVELLGGTLVAQSDGPGRGATFVVELPTATEVPPAGAAPAALDPRNADRPQPAQVLLVDDHPDTLRVTKRLLESSGFAVASAASAEAALSLAAGRRFDVLVSDIGLPDATGHELMRQIQHLYAIPGIAISGFGMDTDLRTSRDAGFVEHLVKPFTLGQLEAAILRVCKNGQDPATPGADVSTDAMMADRPKPR
jgi:PAS domain S-box-containing protein